MDEDGNEIVYVDEDGNEIIYVEELEEVEIEVEEEDEPASASAKPAAKAKSKASSVSGDDAARAVGQHLKKAGGMFSAFKEEYDKARK